MCFDSWNLHRNLFNLTFSEAAFPSLRLPFYGHIQFFWGGKIQFVVVAIISSSDFLGRSCFEYYYGYFDDVSGRALGGHWWRSTAFPLLCCLWIGIIQIPFPSENCFHIPIDSGLLNDIIHIVFHFRITFKITINQYFSFSPWNIQSFG